MLLSAVLCATTHIHAAPATALAFAPDGSALLSSGHGSVLVRSPKNGALQERIPCELPRIQVLVFDPRGHFLVIGGGEPGLRGEAQLMDWLARKVVNRWTNFADVVTCAAFSENGNSLALGSADRSVNVYQRGKGWRETALAFEPEGHTGPVLAVAFGPREELLVSASADRSLKVWSLTEQKLVRSLNNHTDPAFAVAVRPDSEEPRLFQVASASADRTVRVWQPAIGRMMRIVRGHHGDVFALAYSPDGRFIYSAGAEGIVRRIDAESDQVRNEWQAFEDTIYTLAISPDGQTLAAGAWNGEVKCRELRSLWAEMD